MSIDLGAPFHRLSKRHSRRNLYDWVEAAIAEHGLGPRHRIVNIGAGGEVADVLARAGLACLAVDIDPARKPDLVASADDLRSIDDASCDAVFCIEVFEHFARPEAAAAEVLRILRPGGLLIGSTPFLLGIHDAPADYRRFTRHGIRLLFTGQQEVALRERNGYFSAAAVLLTRRFVTGSPRERRLALLLSPIFLALTAVLELLDWVLPSTDGTTGYFFIYRKPGV